MLIKRSYPNLFLIAGNGRKSGKTTLACRLIRQFSDCGVTAIKISSHIHEPSPGLIPVSDNKGYAIYEETNRSTGKDTSRMLRSGAVKVYYISLTEEGSLPDAFAETIAIAGQKRPVICESPSLIRYIEPGMFAIMISKNNVNPRDIKEIRKIRHIELTIEKLSEAESLPFSFNNGKWSSIQDP